jgi:hypothetical protein
MHNAYPSTSWYIPSVKCQKHVVGCHENPTTGSKIAVRAQTATMAKQTTITLLLQPRQRIILHLLCFFLIRFVHVVDMDPCILEAAEVTQHGSWRFFYSH